MITIRSTASDRALQIGELNGAFFPVWLIGYAIEAHTELWAEHDAPSLFDFLKGLGARSRPWDGELAWNSLEGDMGLVVTCSALGAVTFGVKLSGMPGAPEQWTARAGIETGFGELERIALSAEGLMDAI